MFLSSITKRKTPAQKFSTKMDVFLLAFAQILCMVCLSIDLINAPSNENNRASLEEVRNTSYLELDFAP